MPGSLRRATDTTGSEIPEQPSRPSRPRKSLTVSPVRPLPWIAAVVPSMPSPSCGQMTTVPLNGDSKVTWVIPGCPLGAIRSR